MNIITKIKDIIFKIKDYDRLEHDYSVVIDYATGGRLSKTNYKVDDVCDVIYEYWNDLYDKHKQ